MKDNSPAEESMEFTQERTEDGVTRRSFELTVAGEAVPAVIWAPEGAKGPRPLVLMGHGGSPSRPHRMHTLSPAPAFPLL